MWVKDSDMNKGPIIPPAPKAIHGNIQVSSLKHIGRSTNERIACRDKLKVWFNQNIITDFSEKMGSKIMYFVVSNKGKTTPRTRESMNY